VATNYELTALRLARLSDWNRHLVRIPALATGRGDRADCYPTETVERLVGHHPVHVLPPTRDPPSKSPSAAVGVISRLPGGEIIWSEFAVELHRFHPKLCIGSCRLPQPGVVIIPHASSELHDGLLNQGILARCKVSLVNEAFYSCDRLWRDVVGTFNPGIHARSMHVKGRVK
jgi:hypothetical protein